MAESDTHDARWLRAGGQLATATADKLADAIAQQITVEAPLAIADHEAILEALERSCPASLYRLHQNLVEEQRRVRTITGG